MCGTGFFVDECIAGESDGRRRAGKVHGEKNNRMMDAPGVPCGVIGEIGCSRPITTNERKVLEAAALAKQQTGNPS